MDVRGETRRVIIAHPDRLVREEYKGCFGEGMQVVSVGSIEELEEAVSRTSHGIIVASTFKAGTLDGIDCAVKLRGTNIGNFDGVILGHACSWDHVNKFSNFGITSGEECAFVARVMKVDLEFVC